MSQYEQDSRVQLRGDGTAFMPAVSWESDEWEVIKSGDGGFYTVSADRYLAVVRVDDGWIVPWRFKDRDKAIGAALGEPRNS